MGGLGFCEEDDKTIIALFACAESVYYIERNKPLPLPSLPESDTQYRHPLPSSITVIQYRHPIPERYC